MTSQESPVPMPSSSEEAREELKKQELEAITGGISTEIPLGTLRRSFSESDLSRIAQVHPNGLTPLGSPVAMGSPGSDSAWSNTSLEGAAVNDIEARREQLLRNQQNRR